MVESLNRVKTAQTLTKVMNHWDPQKQHILFHKQNILFTEDDVPATQRFQSLFFLVQSLKPFAYDRFNQLSTSSQKTLSEVEVLYHEGIALKTLLLEIDRKIDRYLKFFPFPVRSNSRWTYIYIKISALFPSASFLLNIINTNSLALNHVPVDYKAQVKQCLSWVNPLYLSLNDFCNNLLFLKDDQWEFGGMYFIPKEVIRPRTYKIGATSNVKVKAAFIEESWSGRPLSTLQVGIQKPGAHWAKTAIFQRVWSLNIRQEELNNALELLNFYARDYLVDQTAVNIKIHCPWLYVDLMRHLSHEDIQTSLQVAIEMFLSGQFQGLIVNAKQAQSYQMRRLGFLPKEDGLFPEKTHLERWDINSTPRPRLDSRNPARRFYSLKSLSEKAIVLKDGTQQFLGTWSSWIAKHPLLLDGFRWPKFYNFPPHIPTFNKIMNRQITGKMTRYKLQLVQAPLEPEDLLEELPQLGRMLAFEKYRHSYLSEQRSENSLANNLWKLKRTKF